MRPVNLIPKEERRGSAAPSRTGSAAYFVVGGLVLVLVGVCAVVFMGNQVTDKQSQVESLEAQAVETEARAESLNSYVSFAAVRETRAATIDSLAKSRFDWERVIRELSLVIPKNVWLSNLTGTVAPEVQLDDGASIGLRSSIPGPALEFIGCARSQPAIASFIASLNDIDGITRVTAVNGIKTATEDSASTGGGAQADTSATSDGTCPPSSPSFQVVAAFDAVVLSGADVPPATVAPTDSTATATSAPAAGASTTGTTSTDSTTGTTGNTSTTSEQQQVQQATDKAKRAANIVPGAGG